MHGLVNRSLQSFLRDTYGAPLWDRLAEGVGVGPQGFEAMLVYDDGLTDALLDAAACRLKTPREALLEDLGTYLVSREALRRLLRFGGIDFADFLQSLDELPERVRLALPDLDFPPLALVELSVGQYRLDCGRRWPGFARVMAGVLRAMADDYGALVLIDSAGTDGTALTVELLDMTFAAGRSFALARPECL